MLYLTRKVGESIMIGDNTEVVIMAVKGKTVKLGFSFPPQVSVLRREVYDRIRAENRAALEAGQTITDIFLQRHTNNNDDTNDDTAD